SRYSLILGFPTNPNMLCKKNLLCSIREQDGRTVVIHVVLGLKKMHQKQQQVAIMLQDTAGLMFLNKKKTWRQLIEDDVQQQDFAEAWFFLIIATALVDFFFLIVRNGGQFEYWKAELEVVLIYVWWHVQGDLKSMGSIEDCFISGDDYISLRGNLWLYDEVRQTFSRYSLILGFPTNPNMLCKKNLLCSIREQDGRTVVMYVVLGLKKMQQKQQQVVIMLQDTTGLMFLNKKKTWRQLIEDDVQQQVTAGFVDNKMQLLIADIHL
ncbi:hypothetical protein Tco_0576907, partial [Tanacetum coccineum]